MEFLLGNVKCSILKIYLRCYFNNSEFCMLDKTLKIIIISDFLFTQVLKSEKKAMY